MSFVERYPDESLESMLKRFRRKLQESGRLSVYRRTRFFVAKSEAKRDKERRAARRLARRQRAQERRAAPGRRTS